MCGVKSKGVVTRALYCGCYAIAAAATAVTTLPLLSLYTLLPRLREEHAAEAAAHPLDRTAQARL